jgi:hypothetical protein
VPQLRVVFFCQRCARLELRYVNPARPSDPDVISFPMPPGWRQQWDSDAQAFVILCERCAEPPP